MLLGFEKKKTLLQGERRRRKGGGISGTMRRLTEHRAVGGGIAQLRWLGFARAAAQSGTRDKQVTCLVRVSLES